MLAKSVVNDADLARLEHEGRFANLRGGAQTDR